MDVNWISIILAAIVSMAVGTFWYSHFSKEWMELAKVKPEQKDAVRTFAAASVQALVSAWALALVINFAGAYSLIGGAVIGFLMWLGFSGSAHFSRFLWEGAPFKLFLINGGCTLVTLLLTGAIIGFLG